MAGYLDGLDGAAAARRASRGRMLMVTSQGGVMDAADVAAARRSMSINSGPGDGAGRRPLLRRGATPAADTAIVADTGGTTYDVSLVRDGRIPWTRETWIGQPLSAAT